MERLLPSLLSGLTGRAVRRGLLGGHPGWRLVLVAVGLRHLLRLLSTGRPTVLREDLSPGESLLIRHRPRTDVEVAR